MYDKPFENSANPFKISCSSSERLKIIYITHLYTGEDTLRKKCTFYLRCALRRKKYSFYDCRLFD